MPTSCSNYVATSAKKKKQRDQSKLPENFALWPQILAKAMLKVSRTFGDVPFIHLVTG